MTRPHFYRRASWWHRFCVWADVHPAAAPIMLFAFGYVGVVVVMTLAPLAF